ncbi:MAG: 7-cyano-7-deazaguanine synthase [Thermoguttaceae bacterium]|nr:7-cyano-7-deazaguanine synthase [Thermoguttaceae bacterium]
MGKNGSREIEFSSTVAVLLSGGLDSVILLGHLLRQSVRVQPLYVRCGLVWEGAEQTAVRKLLSALSCPQLLSLVTLEFPVGDLYGDHWSITGQCVPAGDSPAEAVFLPGRNVCLLVKAGIWCALQGINQLALGVLGTNPFSDAQPRFFSIVEEVVRQSLGKSLRIIAPFGQMTKAEVMELGRDLPLELSFSCIAPEDGLHCGRCNKCAERKEAFALAGLVDRTCYYFAPEHTNGMLPSPSKIRLGE